MEGRPTDDARPEEVLFSLFAMTSRLGPAANFSSKFRIPLRRLKDSDRGKANDVLLGSYNVDGPKEPIALGGVHALLRLHRARRPGEFRRRRVPVVMGGFHATLMTEEVKDYAEAVVVGEAEELWPHVIEDARTGHLQPIYQSNSPRILN